MKKRQLEVDQMEVQLQNALKQASSASAANNTAATAEVEKLRKRVEALEKEKSALALDLVKSKEESKAIQAELERLLKIMSTLEDEKFALTKQIQELQRLVLHNISF